MTLLRSTIVGATVPIRPVDAEKLKLFIYNLDSGFHKYPVFEGRVQFQGMRLRMNDDRKRRFENLQSAVDEKTKSKALDRAANFTIRMLSGNPAQPTGALEELLKEADEQGSLTASRLLSRIARFPSDACLVAAAGAFLQPAPNRNARNLAVADWA